MALLETLSALRDANDPASAHLGWAWRSLSDHLDRRYRLDHRVQDDVRQRTLLKVMGAVAAMEADTEGRAEAWLRRVHKSAHIDHHRSRGSKLMDQALKTGKFNDEDYSKYAQDLLPTATKNVMLAGKLQVDHFEEVIKQWRKEMGEEEWSRLYAVVSSAWAMRRQNVHFQILAQMMGREAVNNRLIMAEAINNVTEDDLLMLLGRVVNDRVLSILVFDKTYRMDVELMGEAARAATKDASCPLYPALDSDWMPYEQHKMPNEK